MTLVQVLSDQHSVHMACDFRLTDGRTGELVQDRAHKLIPVGVVQSHVVGFTGLAQLDGVPIGSWIVENLGGNSASRHLDDLVRQLKELAEAPLSKVADASLRRTTFVVGGMVGTQARVSLVSNFEVLIGGAVHRAELAATSLSVSSVRPKKPIYFNTGVVGAVPRAKQEKVKTLLRSGASDEVIQQALAELNAAVSATANTVSEGCDTQSRHATGHGSGRPFLTDAQSGEFIPPDSLKMFNDFNFRPSVDPGSPGQSGPLRLVSSTYVSVGAGDAYYRGQLELRPDDAELWNNYGADLDARRKGEAAGEAFRRACELAPDNPIYLSNYAHWINRHEEDYEKADRLFRQAMGLWGDEAPGWAMANYAALREHAFLDLDGAASLLRQASERDDYPLGKAQLGSYLVRTTEGTEEAKQLFGEAVALAPTDPEVLYLLAHAEFFKFQERDLARRHIEQACGAAPERSHLLALAGDICLALRDGASAAYYYRKAAARGDTHPALHTGWGLALLLNRKPTGAMRHLQRALKEGGDDLRPVVEINLAATEWAMGSSSAARLRMHGLLDVGLQPDYEIEVLAMLKVAGDSSRDARLQELLQQGVTADAITLLGMVSASNREVQRRADELVRELQGAEGRPGD